MTSNWKLARAVAVILLGLVALAHVAMAPAKADDDKWLFCVGLTEVLPYDWEVTDCDSALTVAMAQCEGLGEGYSYRTVLGVTAENWPWDVAAAFLRHSVAFYCPWFADPSPRPSSPAPSQSGDSASTFPT